MSDQQPQPLPAGRARGRVKGAPRTAEEARTDVRKPGEEAGRGLSVERGRGQGAGGDSVHLGDNAGDGRDEGRLQ